MQVIFLGQVGDAENFKVSGRTGEEKFTEETGQERIKKEILAAEVEGEAVRCSNWRTLPISSGPVVLPDIACKGRTSAATTANHGQQVERLASATQSGLLQVIPADWSHIWKSATWGR